MSGRHYMAVRFCPSQTKQKRERVFLETLDISIIHFWVQMLKSYHFIEQLMRNTRQERK